MALFEVFIPAATPDGFNITAKIRADSWVQALRSGLARLGDNADVRNVMVDIKEDGIDVTEPSSGRVFRIKQLEDTQAAAPVQVAAPVVAAAPGQPTPQPVVAAAPVQAVVQLLPPAPGPSPVLAVPQPQVAHSAPPAARPQTIIPRTAPAPAQQQAAAAPPALPPRNTVAPRTTIVPVTHPAGPVFDIVARNAAAQAATHKAQRFQGTVQEENVVQQKSSAPVAPIGRVVERASNRAIDDLLGELFQMTQELYDQPNLEAAANFVLDLAMRSVAADAGSVFISDINAMDLYFAAARGPKGNEVMKFRVPMGQGIVGFCAQEGVSLAISEVQRDPRFCANISKSIGYETRSILCAPAQAQGRVFGAIELLNKTHGSSFTAGEVNVLNFLAHEFAEYLKSTGAAG
jgi:hypothetical protein